MSSLPPNTLPTRHSLIAAGAARPRPARREEPLKALERAFDVEIVARGNELAVSGSPESTEQVRELVEELVELQSQGKELSGQDLQVAIDLARRGQVKRLGEMAQDVLLTTPRGRQVRPKTLGQRRYVEAIRHNDIVFGIGPAGTGKTYLAVAMAVAALREREFARLVLTRPAVEAGEKLGFLPGDLQEKVNPYLRPLHDALWDMLGVDTFERYVSRGAIEVAPLAYMRGRTLDDSFVILDEAQNTTPEQMKMFLTRLGFGSKAVITGDVTQVDLPRDQYSGLQVVRGILQGIEGIAFVYLQETDVVRHPLVQKVIQAYERYEEAERSRDARK
ncbi:MAG: PhoH family protein [Clostridia bacterium]|nr:PhoH family protein [Clostridia bacterium]